MHLKTAGTPYKLLVRNFELSAHSLLIPLYSPQRRRADGAPKAARHYDVVREAVGRDETPGRARLVDAALREVDVHLPRKRVSHSLYLAQNAIGYTM